MPLKSISDPINDAYGASEDENGNRTYTTEHICYADEAGMSPWAVMTDPKMAQPHISVAPWDDFATCRKRTPIPWEDDTTWFVKIEWSTARQETSQDADPLLRPVTGNRRCMDVEVPTFFDRGRPIVNTAGNLIPGCTNTANITVVEVEALFSVYPISLEALNNTLNAAPVQIHGVWYPAMMCWMKNTRLSDTPEEEYGIEFYRATYEIHIDPRGFWELRPNTGLSYLEYQKRTATTGTGSEFKKCTFAEYEEVSDSALKQVQEKRAKGSDGMLLSDPIWLDAHGQPTKPKFPSAPIGNASGTAGSKTLTVAGAEFTDADVGVVLTLAFPSPTVQPVQLIVEKVNSETSVDVHIAATENFGTGHTKPAVPCTVSGALFKIRVKQPTADWSDLPLPPAPPEL
jgi:hypothetical protein